MKRPDTVMKPESLQDHRAARQSAPAGEGAAAEPLADFLHGLGRTVPLQGWQRMPGVELSVRKSFVADIGGSHALGLEGTVRKGAGKLNERIFSS